MRKVELTLSSNYVANWGLADAVRELFQNAIDQGEWTHYYDADEETISIHNENASLAMNTLLLGTSSKSANSIGQFGEGYKIAALVLLREGKEMCIYTGGEVWRPRMIKSRRFGAEILTFFIERATVRTNTGITVVVSGITTEEWHTEIVPSNLYLQEHSVLLSATEGDVLEGDTFKGQVYVGGLFVCTYPQYTYGYNFKPGYLKLDRDRKLASDFDLKWLASTIWRRFPKQAAELAMVNAKDVAYVASMSCGDGPALSAAALDAFRAKYGVSAVPCVSQEQLNRLPQHYKGIFVNDVFYSLITSATGYTEPEELYQATPLERLGEWIIKYEEKYGCDELCDELKGIYDEMI